MEELKHFPRGAILRELTVKGHKGPGDESLVQLRRQGGYSREKEVLSTVEQLTLVRLLCMTS